MRPIRNLLFITALVLVVFAALFPAGVYAKLFILPPDQMNEKSDVIVTGKVEQLTPAKEKGKGQEAAIRIHRVLKQSEQFDREPFRNSGLMPLQEMIYMTGAVIQAIPPVGTEVMIFLKYDERGVLHFPSDSNNIAIIQNNKVTESYKGINAKEKPYAETYNEFLQNNPPRAQEGEGRGDEASMGVQTRTMPRYTYAVVAAGSLLLLLGAGVAWFRVKRARGDGPS